MDPVTQVSWVNHLGIKLDSYFEPNYFKETNSMFLPYEVDVLLPRLPVANFVIIGLCFGIFGLEVFHILPGSLFAPMVLDGWGPVGLFGHMFLHADFGHVLFNMLFLYIFGNVICARLGNFRFLVVYIFLGLMAAVFFNVLSGGRCVGASGAISGIIGFYLVLEPVSLISCAWWLFFRGGSVQIKSFWMILFWVVCDIIGVVRGGGHVAHWAHLGGLISGVGVGLLFVNRHWIDFESEEDQTLPRILSRKKQESSTGVLPGENQENEAASTANAPGCYVHSEGQQLGPYSDTIIQRLIKEKKLTSADLIFDDASQAWVSLSSKFPIISEEPILVWRDGQQYGPYSIEEIKADLASGMLSGDDLGFQEGMKDWQSVKSIPVVVEALKPKIKMAARTEVVQSQAVVQGAYTGVMKPTKQKAKPYKDNFQSPEEKGIITVGTLYYFVALLSAVGGLMLGQQVLTVSGGAMKLIYLSFFTLVPVMGYSWVGFAIRKRQKWAAQSCVVGALLLLLAFPIGTVMGGYVLSLLRQAWPYFNVPSGKITKHSLLSTLVPGLGQYLRGEKIKGILWFAVIFSLFVASCLFAKKTLRVPSGSNGFWYFSCVMGMGLAWGRMMLDATKQPEES